MSTEPSKKSAAHLLHFVTAVDKVKGTYSFCCESQPLKTVRSYQRPRRCPFCQELDPVGNDRRMATLAMNQTQTVGKSDVWPADVERREPARQVETQSASTGQKR
jgi:hypothetical protein